MSSEGQYSPSMVRRAVSADTGFVQISTLTQVINVWLGMWLEANMIHDLRHSDARERAKYGFALTRTVNGTGHTGPSELTVRVILNIPVISTFHLSSG